MYVLILSIQKVVDYIMLMVRYQVFIVFDKYLNISII